MIHTPSTWPSIARPSLEMPQPLLLLLNKQDEEKRRRKKSETLSIKCVLRLEENNSCVISPNKQEEDTQFKNYFNYRVSQKKGD